MDCPAIAYYRSGTTKGDCFAKAHISTAQTPARQDARVPRTHEDQRRPQGAGGAPQEGTPSAYPRIVRGALRLRAAGSGRAYRFRVKRGSCGAEILTRCTARESAARVPTSQFSSAPMNCRKAAWASASRRRWAGRWCAIGSGGVCAKWCAATGWRYPQDGTWSYTRRARWGARSLRR
jgi:hypothetical protein